MNPKPKEQPKKQPEAEIDAPHIEESVDTTELDEARDAAIEDIGAELAQERAKMRAGNIATFLDETGEVAVDTVEEHAEYIPLELLYQIESKKPGTLLEVFAKETSKGVYEFDFADNLGNLNTIAQAHIGLSAFFGHMPEVRGVEVNVPDGGTMNGVREGYKGSFYDQGNYVEVLSGYTVKVTEKISEAKIKEIEKKRDEKIAEVWDKKNKPRFKSFMKLVSGDKYAGVSVSAETPGEDHAEKLTYKIVEAAANYDIDPHLVMSLLMAENGDNGEFFGVKLENSGDFDTQLEWALRLIKTHEQNYKRLSKKSPYQEGKKYYSVEFISFFSDIYSPLSSGNVNHFNNLKKNYFKLRAEVKPIFTKDDRKRGLELAQKQRGEYEYTGLSRSPDLYTFEGGVSVRDIVPSAGRMSSFYGWRMHPIDKIRKFHNGVDIAATEGTPVKAMKPGTVSFAGPRGGYGNVVFINHTDGTQTRYAHLRDNSLLVKKGDELKAIKNPDTGKTEMPQIAQIGSTGKSTGPHLHFELLRGGKYVDPIESTPKTA